MATHSMSPPTRQSLDRWIPSITAISTLGLTILEGLGEFGLASNGICPTLLAETTPRKVGSKPSVGNEPTQ